jgi:hypothetical protein
MGFENVVRPAVLPNIRPPDARAKPTPPADKGTAVINSNPARGFDLSYSYSFNASSAGGKEKEREVDEVRVYQMDDDGNINRDNFIDIQIPSRIKMEGASGPGVDDSGPGPRDDEGIRQSETHNDHYRPVQEEANIEVRKRNFVLRSGEELGPI